MSISLDRGAEVGRRLQEARDEAVEVGWDGYGAAPADPRALDRARLFLAAVPPSFPLPDVSLDPSGDVLFEWHVECRWVCTTTIDAAGTVCYAALLGPDKVHGREQFVGVVPETILAILLRLSQRQSQSQLGL